MWDLGIGVGLRAEMMDELEEVCAQVDFVEVNCPRRWTESLQTSFQFVAARKPVVVHSITLSVGTQAEMDPQALDFVSEVADFVSAPWVSEHLSFTDAGDVSISTFIPMPYTEEAVNVVARNIRHMARVLRRPVLVENVTHSIRWPQDEMPEVAFINRVLSEADCGLLLDVTNLHINATTLGYDKWEFLEQLDRDRVVQMHVAGYTTAADGRLFDSHVGGVDAAVLGLAEWAFRHTSCRSAIIERDQQLSGLNDVVPDLILLREAFERALGARRS
jgi:hypothetical protein